jgi:hypothetical protein
MRTLLAAVAATAVATTLGGAGYALAQPAATTSDIGVVAHSAVDKTIDLGRKGFSVGDQELSAAKLTHGGKAYGHLDGTCVVTFATKAKADELCSQTFRLPGGSITTAGTVASTPQGPGPFDWAITGGTGDYADASGFVHVIPGNGPTIHMTIHVTH